MSAMAVVGSIVQRLFRARVNDFDFTPIPEPPQPKTEEELAVERMRLAILRNALLVAVPLQRFATGGFLVAYDSRKGMRPCFTVGPAKGRLIFLRPLDAPHRVFTRRWSPNRGWIIAPQVSL